MKKLLISLLITIGLVAKVNITKCELVFDSNLGFLKPQYIEEIDLLHLEYKGEEYSLSYIDDKAGFEVYTLDELNYIVIYDEKDIIRVEEDNKSIVMSECEELYNED